MGSNGKADNVPLVQFAVSQLTTREILQIDLEYALY